MDQLEESDAERKERPGCGCFRHSGWRYGDVPVAHSGSWKARRSEPFGSHASRLGKSSLRIARLLLFLSAFLWGGFYLFGKRFIQVLYWGLMCIAALAILGYVIVIVGTLLGFK